MRKQEKAFLSFISVAVVIVMLLSANIFFVSATEGENDPVTSAEETESAPETTTEPTTTAPTKPKKKLRRGWYTTKNGRKKYYVKGKAVKGKIKKLKKYTYYFNKKGYMVTGKTVKYKKRYYYLSNKGRVRASRKKKKYYHADGTKMTTAEAEDWKTRITAESLVAEITDDSMTKKEKLRACFDWVMAKPYITYRKFYPTDYWPATYANDHFLNKGGDCHADAGAFAYLAVAVGYKNVYVCLDCNGISAQGHAWTEINGRVYDPLFAQAKSFSKNYDVPYGTYVLQPILHINMDYNSDRPKK